MNAKIEAAAAEALGRARDRLLALQDERGVWKGELETNVTMDAEDLMLRQFLDIPDRGIAARAGNWVRSQQRPDGGWSIYHGGDDDLNATIEAWVALRLAGDPPDAAHMKRAQEVALDLGGIERSRVFTRIWLALFGQWSWDDLPALPPEVILLPKWFPLNIYDFASWARQTIVPLCVVASYRPARSLGFETHVLRTGMRREEKLPLSSWGGRFQALDRFLHMHERHPIGPLRSASRKLCAEWILRRQESDGCFGGIQPPWVYSIMALHLMGYPLDHPAIAKAISGLETFAVEDRDLRRLEACQSPVWDTCLALVALRDAGVAPDHPAMLSGARYLLDEEVRVQGDWAVRRPDLAPGGWAFEFQNDNYPDVDDTAEVILALRGTAADREEVDGAVQRAVDWTFGMQCADGGFAAFDVDNTRGLCEELPFCDFGEVIDPPSADVTAHTLEMLAAEGLADDPRAVRARDWLLRAQEPDGSWFGRWGANYIYGTGAVVPALIDAGLPADHPSIRHAVRWLLDHQAEDGGWGEDLRSYDDPRIAGTGTPTPSQTAWALLALLAAGERGGAVERGIGWLVEHQRADGNWDEEPFTGTGFPGDFYIRYHMYRLNFPVMALGRYLARRT